MKYISKLLLGIAIVLCGCSNNEKSDLKQVHIPAKHDKCVNIDALTDSVFTVDVANDIPMFGEIDKVLFTDNRILLREKSVFSNTPIKSIDFKGGDYKQYGVIGRGPKEYITAFEFAVNHKKKEIWIYDRDCKKLLFFDIDSKELKNTQSLKNYLLQFKILGNNTMVAYADKEGDNELIAFDINSLKRQFGKYTYNEPIDTEIPRIFSNNKEAIYFIRPASDTVQMVKSDGLTPLFRLNFGKYAVDTEFINTKGLEAKMQYAKSNALAIITEIHKSDNNLLFKYMKKGKQTVGVLNNKLRLILHGDKIKYKGCVLPQPIAIWNDFLVFTIHSDMEEYASISKSENLTFLFIRLK